MSQMCEILIEGKWQESSSGSTIQAINPATGQEIGQAFPVSDWQTCDRALAAASAAAKTLQMVPRSAIANFLRSYADAIEANADALVEQAHRETALPVSPRLKDVELPRTSNQLRLAADACEHATWAEATIDSAGGIRSSREAIGPTLLIGPNNFPLAFNGISGGDFAAAIAAGNPVIAKGHPAHPNTTFELARLAKACLEASELPAATVQVLFHMSPDDGLRMVQDPRLGAVAFTGSKASGLKIKAACDQVGTPVFLELSSVNPVVMLPGALEERGTEIAGELTASCNMGCGQFCTNPGLILLTQSSTTDSFIQELTKLYQQASAGSMLTPGVREHLDEAVKVVRKAGAELLTGGQPADEPETAYQPTLLKVSGEQFLEHPAALQTEMFGPVTLLVVAEDPEQQEAILEHLEGNLTGCLYSAADGRDDVLYDRLAPRLLQRVGRLLNDKMPTGVAVSPAMNHGGPFPSTGHPGFTAVGIPASLKRFSALKCYDNVRPERLPVLLRNANPDGQTWRFIDGQWTTGDVQD